ncbi:MAG: polysaccharide biosynthesis protein [Butyricicoccus sp.]|nr:polysaccharide biosynthesis protein [Butyricicoccus sp.]
MSDNRKQNYLHGAAILTAGVVIMKILGAIYKIPLGNILGDEGYGYFLTAYNIYNIFLTLATAGLPVALSRMISEANTLKRPMQARRTFKVALATFAVVGIVGTVIMYLLPTELAIAMNSPKSAQSIFALAPAVLLCCLLSAYRGYCQGHSNMIPTTVGQVLEVIVKVIVGVALALIFTRQRRSLPECSSGAIFGVTAGSLAAMLYMLWYKRRNYVDGPVENPDTPAPHLSIVKDLLIIGIPITLGASVMSLISLIDNKLVLYQLQMAAGFSQQEADVLWGVYGKAMTLYNLPASFITPLTISVVPSIAACVASKRHIEGCEIGENSLRIASVICMPMGVGLAVLSTPIMKLVYPSAHGSGGRLLMFMGIASVLVCLALMSNAILQAHGNERYPIISVIAGGAAKIAVNWTLVGNPDINIVGAPIGTICCYGVMCLFNYIFLCRCMERRPRLSKTLLRPVLSCAVMGAAAWGLYGLLEMCLSGVISFGIGRLSAGWIVTAISAIGAIGAAVTVYLVMAISMRAVTLEDMKLIPRGEKIAKLLHIR